MEPLTSAHVDNYGQRRFRRFKTNIGVQYDTNPELLEKFCQKIRDIVHSNSSMRQDNFHVYFNSMGDFSLNIFVYVFFITPDWSEELKQNTSF